MTRLLLVTLAITSCSPDLAKTHQQNAVTKFPLEHIYDYAEIDDTFNLVVVYYTPAPTPCGARASASNCIGVNLNDRSITRVLTICNYDTTIYVGDTLTISPHHKPKYNCTIQTYIIDKEDKYYELIHNKKITTTFGTIKIKK